VALKRHLFHFLWIRRRRSREQHAIKTKVAEREGGRDPHTIPTTRKPANSPTPSWVPSEIEKWWPIIKAAGIKAE
jgi:hypothetical protein